MFQCETNFLSRFYFSEDPSPSQLEDSERVKHPDYSTSSHSSGSEKSEDEVITIHDLFYAEQTMTDTPIISSEPDNQGDIDKFYPHVKLTVLENNQLSHSGDTFHKTSQSPSTTTRPREESSSKQCYKRPKNIEKQGNVPKKAQLSSEVAEKKKFIEPPSLKPPCKCRAQCFEKVNEGTRQSIFDHFWSYLDTWEQRRQFIKKTVTRTAKMRTRVRTSDKADRKKFTYSYSLPVNEDLIPVCQVMFANTLSIGAKCVKRNMLL